MAKVVELKLIREHTHRGVLYPVGSSLELPERKAAFLLGRGVAVLAGEVLAPTHERSRVFFSRKYGSDSGDSPKEGEKPVTKPKKSSGSKAKPKKRLQGDKR